MYEGVHFHPDVLSFGPVCRYKLRGKEIGELSTMTSRWDSGTFVGMCKITGKYLLYANDKIQAVRTIALNLDGNKWDAAIVEAVRALPWQLTAEKKEPEVIFREQVDNAQNAADPQPRQVRKLYIKKSDLDAYGFTQGCRRCDHDLAYGYGRSSMGHSDACRNRIMKRLAETAAGRMRIEACTERMDRHLADVVERADRGQNPVSRQGESANGLPQRQDPDAFEPLEQQQTNQENVEIQADSMPPEMGVEHRRYEHAEVIEPPIHGEKMWRAFQSKASR